MLIAFEGLDGAGKTTVIDLVTQKLRDEGKKVKQVQDPAGTSIGRAIRKILDDDIYFSNGVELLLFAAARRQLVTEQIIPFIDKYIVITDRFTASTIAYQHYGSGFPKTDVNWLVKYSANGVRPDLNIFIDVKADIAFDRRRKAGREGRLDRMPREYYRRVYTGYQTVIERNRRSWAIISGKLSTEEMASACCLALLS